MRHLWRLLRLVHINHVLLKHGLDEIILATHLLRPLRFLLPLAPWRWFHKSTLPRGVRIRLVLEELGPVFIKFGQALSTRQDLLPDDIAVELIKLQDDCPPFDNLEAQRIIEKSFGKTVEELFLKFDKTPLASASIAQVHAAVLPNGCEVIVKVVRPGIKKIIKKDISLLYELAVLAERFWSEGKRLHPRDVVAEFERTILDELDMMRESANASQLRRNFEHSDQLLVPEIFWDYVRPNVLVMERVYGIPVNHIEKLKEQQIDMEQLAASGVEIFFTQVFKHNFFHADMHPGNVFVQAAADNPHYGQYIAIDFGIVGTLSKNDQRYIAENFLAFFNRDYQRVAELHVESGWVPPDTPVNEFESAIRSVCEPIFEKPLKDISFGLLLVNLFQTAARFKMEIQPQLVLLQKTLLSIEGLGRQLYPELDLWKTAKPFLEDWMKERLSFKSFLNTLKNEAPLWAEQAPLLPNLAYSLIHHAHNQHLHPDTNRDLVHIQQTIVHGQKSLLWGVIGAGSLIGGSLIASMDLPSSYGLPWLTWGFGSFSLWCFIQAFRATARQVKV
jgi:ubiquinone biosynthesis protein